MFRKNIYSIHRTLSLMISIPVLLWAMSGFMHPMMTNIRPKIATQNIDPVPIDLFRIKIPLKEALQKNNISNIHSFRFVHIDTNWFYQVQQTPHDIPQYISAQSGALLSNGDELYAKYLAIQFLEGQFEYNVNHIERNSQQNSGIRIQNDDCCEAAKYCVINTASKSKIKQIELLRGYSQEYKFINRLLPVYKVSFDRGDGIRIYVETSTDRFAYAVDNKRAFFDNLFSIFHNWSWMDAAGKIKYLVMALMLSVAIITTLMGVYIFFTTKTKDPKGNSLLKARKNHRITSIVFALFTLMFAFSGAFHALEKLKKDTRNEFFKTQKISFDKLTPNLMRLQEIIKTELYNVSLIEFNNDYYWQVYTKQKSKKINSLKTVYVKLSDYSLLPEGDMLYAKHLALSFSGNDPVQIISTELITKFEGEYGFVNKRLPVWKIGFNTNNNERYYVETSTGKLSVRIDDNELYEGYSFAILHKHHFMDFAGKAGRDISTMFWAMGQIAMVVVGLVLWKKRKMC